MQFSIQWPVRTTKNHQNTFFCQKRSTSYLARKRPFIFLFSQTNRARNRCSKCVWTTIHDIFLEICNAEHVKTPSVFLFQPIKHLVSTTVKNAKPCCHLLDISFREQKPTMTLTGADSTYCFWKKDEAPLRKRDANNFAENFSKPITIHQDRIWTEKWQNQSIYGINLKPLRLPFVELDFKFYFFSYNFDLH